MMILLVNFSFFRETFNLYLPAEVIIFVLFSILSTKVQKTLLGIIFIFIVKFILLTFSFSFVFNKKFLFLKIFLINKTFLMF